MEATESTFNISPVNIRDEVYTYLRERILNHDYPPGFRFDLTEIEQQLGISRTPLKEALQRLEIDGLVKILPRRGTYVTRIDLKEVIDNFRVRHALELYVARSALDDASQSEIDAICAVNDEMRRLSGVDDYEAVIEKYLEFDQVFHRQFVALSRNQRLMTVFERVNMHVQLIRVRQSFNLSLLRGSQGEHDAIQSAFEQRDRDGLIHAVDAHLEASIARIDKALE